MTDKGTMDTIIDREVLKAAVMRRITCPASGVVLDVRTAVYFHIENAAGRAGCEVVDAAAWDGGIGEKVRAIVAKADGLVLEVIDGRTIHKGRSS